MQAKGGINDKVRQFQCKLPMSIPIRVPPTLSRQLNVYMRAQRWPGPDFPLTAKLTTTDLTHLRGSSASAYSVVIKLLLKILFPLFLRCSERKQRSNPFGLLFMGQKYRWACF